MAEHKAPSMGKPIYNGTHGNLSLADNFLELKAVAANDVIRFFDVPIGTVITGIRISNKALGSGVTLDADIRLADGTLVNLVSNRTGNTAGTTAYNFPKIVIADNGPAEAIITVKGATANGRIDVALEFMAEGY